MVKARTHAKFLRRLGILLILLPELITTLFGVAFILAARHLSKRHESSVNSRLRETVHYYVARSSFLIHDADGRFGSPGPIKRQGLNEEHALLGQITGSRSSKARSSIRQGKHDAQDGPVNHTKDKQSLSCLHKPGDDRSDTSTRTQQATHHSLDMEWLSRRYETGNVAMAHSRHARSDTAKGPTHYATNMRSVSWHHETAAAGRTKAKYTNTNRELLQKRFGSAVSHIGILNAVQSNNPYYKMLSRGNVIGGF